MQYQIFKVWCFNCFVYTRLCRWQYDCRLWPDWWEIQLLYITPQMETPINTINNRQECRASLIFQAAQNVWSDITCLLYTSSCLLYKSPNICDSFSTSWLCINLNVDDYVYTDIHLQYPPQSVLFGSWFLSIACFTKCISQSVSSHICSSLVLHTSACWSSLNRGVNQNTCYTQFGSSPATCDGDMVCALELMYVSYSLAVITWWDTLVIIISDR